MNAIAVATEEKKVMNQVSTEPDQPQINFLEEISNYVFTSKYARYIEKLKRRETWDEAVDRVYQMHMKKYGYKLSEEQKKEVEWAFSLVHDKRVVPSMRSMQFGGDAVFAHENRIYNCSVRHVDSIRSFAEILYLLLCGSGVGIGLSKMFLGRLPNLVDASDKTGTIVTYVIEDSIEGWADSIEALLNCYFKSTAYSGRKIVFDYSRIRRKGSKLKTGGGKAPGYKPLKNCLGKIKKLLDTLIEEKNQQRLKSIDAYDILMHCSDAVLSGGVRRSATSIVFEPDDEDMMNAKTGEWFKDNPQRARSNNSVLLLRDKCTVEDFKDVIARTKEFGEPAFVFADDSRELYNPCFEKDTRLSVDGMGLVRIEDLYKLNTKLRVSADNRVGKFDELNAKDFGTSVKEATEVFLTQKNAKVFELVTTHGHKLRVTENHEFPTPNGRKKLNELKIGDVLLLQSGEGSFGKGNTFEEGLALGMITGDGCFTKEGLAFIDIWEDDFDVLDDVLEIANSVSLNHKESGYRKMKWQNQTIREGSDKKKRIGGVGLREAIEKTSLSNDIKSRVPEGVWLGSREYVRGYLQGLIFSDGSVQYKERLGNKKKSTLSIRLTQSNKELLEDVQILLQNFGITSNLYQRTKEHYSSLPNSSGEYIDYKCKPTYELILNRMNSMLFADKIGFYGRKSLLFDKYIKMRGTDCNKKERYITKVKSIEYYSTDDVYCLTQPETNTVCANGLSVGQCFEISFIPVTEDGTCGVQNCNLSSINGAKVKSKEDFFECVKAATIIGTLQAGYTNFKYLSPATKFLTEEEALLGVSITGIMDTPDILLKDTIQKKGASVAVETNKEWAKIIGIKQAARITCVKPEGTVSLVLGSASGIHPHHAHKYFRRVQANKTDNVYQYFQAFNPEFSEESVYSENKTDDVITFPLTVSDKSIVKDDLDAISHLKIIRDTQKNWVQSGTTEANKKPIHHNVSCTVIVKDDEWDAVAKFLFDNKDLFAAVSLLPYVGDKIYAQAPMEKVSTPEDEAKFKMLEETYKQVDYKYLIEDHDETNLQQELSCAGGKCEVL